MIHIFWGGGSGGWGRSLLLCLLAPCANECNVLPGVEDDGECPQAGLAVVPKVLFFYPLKDHRPFTWE